MMTKCISETVSETGPGEVPLGLSFQNRSGGISEAEELLQDQLCTTKTLTQGETWGSSLGSATTFQLSLGT